MSSEIEGQFELSEAFNRVKATKERAKIRESDSPEMVWDNKYDKDKVRIMANLKEINAEHECSVITLANHKGGCQKTTLSFALANYLYNDGYRVLVIDTDPQGSLGNNFKVQGNDSEYKDNTLTSVYKCMSDISSTGINKPIIVSGNICSPTGPAILLLPGERYLIPTVKYAEDINGGEIACRQKFSGIIDTYKNYVDYIIFDTTPLVENSICGVHALSVSDCIIIPIYGVESIENIKSTTLAINKFCKPSVKVLFAFTKYQVDDRELTDKFENKCKSKNLEMCEEPVYLKGKKWIRGHDERRSTVYRFMRKVFPNNTCITGIPEEQRIANGTYANLDRKYKTLYDDLCSEIKKKIRNGEVDDLYNQQVWQLKCAELYKYISIVRDYKTKNTPKKANRVFFENVDLDKFEEE